MEILKKFEIISLVFLISITAFFSTYKLTESPSVWYDEGIYIQMAANMADGYGMSFQFAPDHIDPISKFTVSYPFIYPLSIVLKVFGASIIVARSFMVFLILSLIASLYFLVRKRFGPKIALCSFALVATFPPLYGNGKSVLGEIPALLFLFLSLLSLQQAMFDKVKSKSWIILAGFFAGLCAATKLLFLLFLPVFTTIIIIKWYRDKISKKDLVLAGLFSFLPITVWFFVQFQSSDSLSSLINFYVNPYESGNLLIIAKNNLINFFTKATPLYLLIMMIIWSSSVIIRKREKINIPEEEIVAFLFSILTLASYLRIVGWYRYIFPAQIMAMTYIVPATLVCIRHFERKAVLKIVFNRIRKFGLPIIFGAILFWGIYGTLFNSWVASAYKSDKTNFWKEYFEKEPVDISYFFYNTPEVTIFANNRNYYQYITPAGGPFGSEWLYVIEKGLVDKIFVGTNVLSGEKDLSLKHYHVEREAYKYTILIKN